MRLMLPFTMSIREEQQIKETALSLVKLLTAFTCYNSLINAVTNKFYFGFLMREVNQTYHELIVDQIR